MSFRRWEGEGLDEVGKEEATGIVRVRINEKFFRPSEVVSGRVDNVIGGA